MENKLVQEQRTDLFSTDFRVDEKIPNIPRHFAVGQRLNPFSLIFKNIS
jgi:hypothetical protein